VLLLGSLSLRIEVDPPKYIVHKYESVADVCTSGPRYITESNDISDSENGDFESHLDECN